MANKRDAKATAKQTAKLLDKLKRESKLSAGELKLLQQQIDQLEIQASDTHHDHDNVVE